MLLDNGRSNMVGTEFQDMLRCIRCGACMNHCPVYQAVGGHAYGWVYPGPMGAVLTPSLIGVEEGGQLPNASTFCGRCEEVCPVRIPLPKLMRHWREREFEKRLTPGAVRTGLGVWAWSRGAAGALPAGGAGRDARRCGRWPRARAARGRCRWPAAGPASATCRRRRGGRSWTSGRPGGGERARAHPRAARAGGGAAGGRSARRRSRRGWPAHPARAGAAAGAEPRARRGWRSSWPRPRRRRRRSSRVSEIAELPRRWRTSCASATCRRRCASGPTRCSPGSTGGRSRPARGSGRIEEPATLSRAEFGLAETGTLVLASGPDNPVTLTFLGETHFVVLREADICGGFEDFWAAWRARGARPADDQHGHRAVAVGRHRPGAAARGARAGGAARLHRGLRAESQPRLHDASGGQPPPSLSRARSAARGQRREPRAAETRPPGGRSAAAGLGPGGRLSRRACS